jgi:hypothetical protein
MAGSGGLFFNGLVHAIVYNCMRHSCTLKQ